MESRKSYDASSAKGLELPPSATKRRGSVGLLEVSHKPLKSQELTQDGSLFIEQTKLESLKENVKNQQDKDPQFSAKLGRLSHNIDAVIDKTTLAREELMRMTEITRELKAQTEIQQEECKAMESDQRYIRQDIEHVTKRMDMLLAEKKRVQDRLEAMKDQNNKLQEFLEANKV